VNPVRVDKGGRGKMRHLGKNLVTSVLLILMSFAVQTFAEEAEQQFKKIETSGGFFGPSFSVDGNKIKKNDVEKMVHSIEDEEAEAKLRSYKLYHYTSLVPSGVGGFLVGYSVGYAAFGGEFLTAAFLSGCGAIGVGFLLDKLADGDLAKSVNRYNQVLEEDYGISFLSQPGTGRVLLHLSFSF